MNPIPNCPKCNSEYCYADQTLFNCPECGFEWGQTASNSIDAETESPEGIKDAYGTPLADGDSVIVIKDLKVKGSSLIVKGGTKVKNIRLTDGDHDIDCKIPGIGSMQLKSEFVKKA